MVMIFPCKTIHPLNTLSPLPPTTQFFFSPFFPPPNNFTTPIYFGHTNFMDQRYLLTLLFLRLHFFGLSIFDPICFWTQMFWGRIKGKLECGSAQSIMFFCQYCFAMFSINHSGTLNLLSNHQTDLDCRCLRSRLMAVKTVDTRLVIGKLSILESGKNWGGGGHTGLWKLTMGYPLTNKICVCL